jgi:hypothetical protein
MASLEKKIKEELLKNIPETVLRNTKQYHLCVVYTNETLYISYRHDVYDISEILIMRYKNSNSFSEIESLIFDYVKYFGQAELLPLNGTLTSELKNKVSKELEQLLNRNSVDNALNTPDYILADYLINCLDTFNEALTQIEKRKI